MLSHAWKVIGHTQVKARLDRYLVDVAPPHGLLFLGPDGIGKAALAREFAGAILGTLQPDMHPDFQYLNVADEAFDLDRLREFMGRIGLRPVAGVRSVAILDNVHALTAQAANALLKTLEEPPSEALIIMVSSTDQMLPTLRSRVQTFRCQGLSLPELQEFSRQFSLPDDAELIALSSGAPGRLRYLCEHRDAAKALADLTSRLERLPGQPVGERLAAISDLAEHESTELAEGLRAWLYRIRGNLAAQPDQYTVALPVLEALEHIPTSINKKLILQRLVLNLGTAAA